MRARPPADLAPADRAAELKQLRGAAAVNQSLMNMSNASFGSRPGSAASADGTINQSRSKEELEEFFDKIATPIRAPLSPCSVLRARQPPDRRRARRAEGPRRRGGAAPAARLGRVRQPHHAAHALGAHGQGAVNDVGRPGEAGVRRAAP